MKNEGMPTRRNGYLSACVRIFRSIFIKEMLITSHDYYTHPIAIAMRAQMKKCKHQALMSIADFCAGTLSEAMNDGCVDALVMLGPTSPIHCV